MGGDDRDSLGLITKDLHEWLRGEWATRRVRWILPGYLAGMAVLICLAAFRLPLIPRGLLSIIGQWLLPLVNGVFIGQFCLAAAVAFQFHERRKDRAGLLALLECPMDDIRLIGPLADALRTHDRVIRSAVEADLAFLLPIAPEDEADFLSRAQKEALREELRGGNYRLVVAILSAFERMGDVRSLAAVERLAREGRDGAVGEAAERCRAALQARASELISRELLLRPSESNGASLLRPAGSANQVDEEHLLRAASPQGD